MEVGSMDRKTLREYLFEEIRITQNIVSRMANNSFLIKGWAVTLIVASLLLEGVFYHRFVAFVPWFVFWWFDAYFLRLEKLYRKLYDWLMKNRLANDSFLLDINKQSLEERFGNEVPRMPKIMVSRTLVAFYGFLLFVIVCSILVSQ